MLDAPDLSGIVWPDHLAAAPRPSGRAGITIPPGIEGMSESPSCRIRTGPTGGTGSSSRRRRRIACSTTSSSRSAIAAACARSRCRSTASWSSPARPGPARRPWRAGWRTGRRGVELGEPVLFVDINPHAFPSQLLGESQRSVARLFERTLPDLAAAGSRRWSCSTRSRRWRSPLRGVARHEPGRRPPGHGGGARRGRSRRPELAQRHVRGHLELPPGVDVAFMSRADLVEQLGYPDADAVAVILRIPSAS